MTTRVKQKLIEYPTTTAEITAGVTPSNLTIPNHEVIGYALPSRYGVVGDGVTDDTAAWGRFSSVVQSGLAIKGVIPPGVYLIDSWIINQRGSVFEGVSESAITLTYGVKIKCRSATTNFITFDAATGGLFCGMEIDGNNLCDNTVRVANQITDFEWRKLTIGGCKDNGVNLNLSGTTANTAISELGFHDIKLAGCGSRTSGINITNLLINSDQSVVIAFYRLKHFGNTAGATDVTNSVVITRGTCTFYTPFATKVGTYDYKFGQSGAIGAVTMIDGRSESDTANSIYVVAGTGDITTVNYVHGTTTGTSIDVGSDFSGRVNIIGGQFNNITNSSATADIVLNNAHVYATGAIGGVYASRIIKLMDGVVTAPVRASVTTTLTYGTTVTIDAASSDRHYLLVTNGTAFTMAAPANPTANQTIYIDIQNGHSGAMGAITWNAVFKLAGAFTNPGTGTRRRIQFTSDGASWIEDCRTAADGAV